MFGTIGECWVHTISKILEEGKSLPEYIELRNIILNFSAFSEDIIIAKYGNIKNIENMRRVFFTEQQNDFGHSYKKLIRGPYCKNDFSDVIDVLKEKKFSNRAILNFDNTQSKQPCINTVSFSIRDDKLNVVYFSRGQDFYNKFYCDALCISEIGNYVKSQLQISSFDVTAFIVSGHVYHEDIEKSHILIRDVL